MFSLSSALLEMASFPVATGQVSANRCAYVCQYVSESPPGLAPHEWPHRRSGSHLSIVVALPGLPVQCGGGESDLWDAVLGVVPHVMLCGRCIPEVPGLRGRSSALCLGWRAFRQIAELATLSELLSLGGLRSQRGPTGT